MWLLRARCFHTETFISTLGSPLIGRFTTILIDRRRHSRILGVRSFRRADCDTDHYLVVARVRERLAVSKKAAQNSDGERFNLRKLHELEVRKKYQIEISNRFAALENFSDNKNINRTLENIKQNIKSSVKRV
jgi:hypothetical protein